MEVEISTIAPDEKTNGSFVWTGTTFAQPLGSNIETTWTMQTVEFRKENKLVPTNDEQEELIREMENMHVQILTSERGKLFDFSISSPAMEDLDSDSAKVFEEFKELFRRLVPELPASGVTSGDRIFDVNKTLALPGFGGERMSLAIKAVARGLTRYEGRPSLVVDVSGLAETFGAELPIQGFGVLDIETAAWSLYEEVFAIGMTTDGKTWQLTTRVTRHVDFAPEPAAMTDRQPSRDAIESRLERLKRLLDAGLISPKDAEEKRQEILKQL